MYQDIHLAAEEGDLASIDFLINSKKISPNKLEWDGGETAVHCAARRDKLDALELLLENGGYVDPRNFWGSTPLFYSARKGNVEALDLLEKHGANILATTRNGSTALHTAALYGKANSVKWLLSKGIEVNSEDDDGCTPLHQASSNGSVETIQILLDHGAKVNAQTKKQKTPLHEAVLSGELGALKLLTENGGDPNVKDVNFSYPIDSAKFNKHDDVVKYLLEITKGPDASRNFLRKKILEKFKYNYRGKVLYSTRRSLDWVVWEIDKVTYSKILSIYPKKFINDIQEFLSNISKVHENKLVLRDHPVLKWNLKKDQIDVVQNGKVVHQDLR